MDGHPSITKSSGLEQNSQMGRNWPWQNFRKRKESNIWCKWAVYSQEKGQETWATCVHFSFPKLPIQLTFSSSVDNLEESISNEEVFSVLPPLTTFSSLFALKFGWVYGQARPWGGDRQCNRINLFLPC